MGMRVSGPYVYRYGGIAGHMFIHIWVCEPYVYRHLG